MSERVFHCCWLINRTNIIAFFIILTVDTKFLIIEVRTTCLPLHKLVTVMFQIAFVFYLNSIIIQFLELGHQTIVILRSNLSVGHQLTYELVKILLV